VPEGSVTDAACRAASTAPGAAPAGSLQLAPAPTVQREIRNEHFQAVFSSEGGAIVSWVLPRYPDLIHERRRVRGPGTDGGAGDGRVREHAELRLHFSHAPFRIDETRSSSTSITFVRKTPVVCA
jgi:hypothetical protein